MAEVSHGDNEDKIHDETAERKQYNTVRPPNRKKYEEEIEAMNVEIKAKEGELKSLYQLPDDKMRSELQAIRHEKDATIDFRKNVDSALAADNQEIKKKMAELSKLEINLRYKNEERINEAIARLEDQLKKQNFRLTEEKKIVAEVDSLKRSKKVLGMYLLHKKGIDELRNRQRHMREQRDHYFKRVTQLKQKEDEVKRRAQAGRQRCEVLKKELDELYNRKRQTTADFRALEKDFLQARDDFRRKLRDEISRKREAERRIQMENYQKEQAELAAAREPYDEERTLCATLLAYVQRFGGESENQTGSVTEPTPGGEGREQPDLEAVGLYRLKKKEDDELFGGVVRPKNKRPKREKRKSTVNKPLVHTPEIFAQFASIQLTAPSSVLDVPKSIEQLEAKKSHFESLAVRPSPTIRVEGDTLPQVVTKMNFSYQGNDEGDAPGSASGEVNSVGAPSIAESAICESMPSTPEVMLDNAPPPFARDRDSAVSPMSHDSGACELGNMSDDQMGLGGEDRIGPCADDIMAGGEMDDSADTSTPSSNQSTPVGSQDSPADSQASQVEWLREGADQSGISLVDSSDLNSTVLDITNPAAPYSVTPSSGGGSDHAAAAPGHHICGSLPNVSNGPRTPTSCDDRAVCGQGMDRSAGPMATDTATTEQLSESRVISNNNGGHPQPQACAEDDPSRAAIIGVNNNVAVSEVVARVVDGDSLQQISLDVATGVELLNRELQMLSTQS